MKKKIMALLLAVIMICTMASATTAWAAESDDITSWILEEDTSIAGKVRFWMPFKGEQGMNDLIAAFNEVYPNIEVELTTYSNNADGNLSVNTAIMSGQVDVLGSFGLANTYRRWENDLFMDLTDLVEEDGIDLVANWGTDEYTYDGKVYTFPCGGLSYYVCINMDAWEEAGLGELPTEWTWDEYLDACAAMTKTGADGQVEMYGGSDSHSIECFTFPKYQGTTTMTRRPACPPSAAISSSIPSSGS